MLRRVAAVVFLAGANVMLAQIAPAQPPAPGASAAPSSASAATSNSAAAAAMARSLTFDVVSVKRSTAGNGFFAFASPQDGDSISITNMSPRMMIGFAYGLARHDEIVGLPAWADTESYDVMAKVSAADLPAFRKLLPRERNPMLQPLLADRFRLKCHDETRELPVYALVVGKDGPKLTEEQRSVDAQGRELSGGVQMGRGSIVAHAAPIGAILDALSVQLGRTVVDRTGLTGRYDLTLEFDPAQASVADQPGGNGTSIFTAVQEQLGLKLEPGKGAVPVLVVDAIERPAEN